MNVYIFNSNIIRCLHFTDVETTWAFIKSIIYDAMMLFIPKFQFRSKQYPKMFAKDLPYSTKLWREKTLVDLAVHCQSAKVLSAKKLWNLVSTNIEWALPLPTAKVFPANFLAVPTLPKFSPTKVLCYTVRHQLNCLCTFRKTYKHLPSDHIAIKLCT